ncbi:MAG: hypothetical protein AB7V62_05130 [Thermoleophilia bacterium]
MRARTTLAAVACAVAVAAGGLAGCGEDDDSGSALTREEFIAQADAICATGNEAIEAAIPADGPPGEEFYDVIVDSTQASIDGVDALEPPEDMAADVDALVASANEAMAEVRATPPAEFFARDDDPFAEVNAQAKAIGLTECAQ